MLSIFFENAADTRKILMDQCNSEILEAKGYEKTSQRIKAYHVSMMPMLCYKAYVNTIFDCIIF